MAIGRLTTVQLGEVYTWLTVERWEPRPDGKPGRAAGCRCQCGQYKIVYPHTLRSGKSKSCGCYKAAIARSHLELLPPGESSLNHLVAMYRRSARVAERPFLLTREQFRVLASNACFYCGDPPSREYQCYNRKRNGHFLCNGIDRVDNSKGYEVGNCVSCCAICNRAKGTLSLAQFVEMASKISVRHSVLDPLFNHALIST